MQSTRVLSLSLIFCLTFLGTSFRKPEAQAESEERSAPMVRQAVDFGISPVIRDLPPEPVVKPEEGEDPVKPVKPPKVFRVENPDAPPTVDTALQSRAPSLIATPGPTISFDGINNDDNFALFGFRVSPPDTQGDVGPNHYVQVVNLGYRVWDKTGTPLIPVRKLSSIWSGLGAGNPCSAADDGDPIVLYDPLADRWMISQFCTVANPFNHQLIAVSQTSDPTGAFYLYDFMMPNNKFNDYPKFGVWPDAYYMTDNQFNQAGTAFLGAGVFAFDRAKMLVGDPTASYIYFDVENGNPAIGGMLPSDLDGLNPPPPGTPNYFAYFLADEFGDPSDGLRIFEFVPDFVTPASSTFIERADSPLPVAAFDPRSPSGRDDIEQPTPANSTSFLDSISDRLMYRLAYRNFGTYESLVVNHTVNVSGVSPTTPATHQAGVRYYELQRSLPGGNFAVNEQATFAPDADNRWMGAVSMDNGGNMAVGYSVSNTATFPSIRWAGRLSTDPPNGLFQGEATVIAGSGVQTNTGSRWGDYSGMSIDPSDDCTFWYTQEYYTAASQATSSVGWLTRIATFSFPSCIPATTGTLEGTVTDAVSTLPIANALVQTSDGYIRSTDAAGFYTMDVPAATYDMTASKQFYQTGTAPNVIVTTGSTTVQDFVLVPLPFLEAAGSTLDSEGCAAPNGAIDPGETVSVTLSVQNTGAADTVNLVGTLLPTGGVTSPSGPQNYGVVVAGGPAVGRSYTFTADAGATCGGTIIASLQLQDGATDLGTVTYTFTLGTVNPIPINANYSSGNVITPIPDVSSVDIPLTITDGGFASDVNALVRLNHTFDGDLVLTLIHPDGTAVVLSSNRGGAGDNYGSGSNDCSGTHTVFDDAAGVAISAGAAPFAASFRPEGLLSALNGKSITGTWILRVSDTAALDIGTVFCFQLEIARQLPVCCGVAGTPILVESGGSITAESCTPNSAIDPDETVTVDFGIANAGDAPTTNLVATLLATGGVTNPSGPQTYGVVPPDGSVVTRPFTFAAAGSCGGTLTATLQLQDGPTDLGTLTYTFTLGSTTIANGTFSNATTITIPSSGTATPYPSNITVNGMPDPITNVTVTLTNMNHTFPSDIDILLVGPGGQSVILMSDVGGGTDIVNVTLTLDDTAASGIPGTIVSGTYLPTNIGAGDIFAGPAPAGPYGATLSVFNGTVADGIWSLYVTDDAGGDSGNITSGWSITITTAVPNCCAEPCALTCTNASADNDPAQCGAVVNFTPGIAGLCGVVTATPPSGSFFPVGTTTVTVDSSASAETCTLDVTVADVEAPTITCPADQTFSADNGSGATVNYVGPTVGDNCPGANASCVPPSGSFFPIGLTPVSCTAMDASANSSSPCGFDVTVNAEIGNVIAVDPAGRFVLYSMMGTCGREILVLRRLDGSGNPVGAVREIVGCGVLSSDVNGIDLLQDTTNLYWISFGGTMLSDSKYLMQIDSSGNITKAAQAMVPAVQFGSTVGATSLQKKGNLRLVLWMIGDGGSVYRAMIDKTSMTLMKVKKTYLLARDAKTMQATHSGKNFLAIENPLDVLKGFGLNKKPLPDGTSWRLSPATDGGHGTGGVSSDGLMAFSNNYDPPLAQLYVQPLRSDGIPTGSPKVVVTDDVIAEDVSNAMESVRYVVYLVTKPSGNHVYLQKIDAVTGDKIGARILID